jgi:hypothetical protein
MLANGRRSGPSPRGPFEDKRRTFTTRITELTRKALDAAAEATGRSLSQEIEVRLEATFHADREARAFSDVFYGTEFASLLEVIAKAMREAGAEAATMAGAGRTDWLDSPAGYRQATLAALEVLRAFSPIKPEAEGPTARKEELGTRTAEKLIGCLADPDGSNRSDKSWALTVRQRLGKLRERIAAECM